MKTKILRITNKNQHAALKKSAAILKRGGVVVFPTETVYGIGANIYSNKGIEKIFKAKGRPSDNPLIVHVSGTRMLSDLVGEISPLERKLIKKFWPGPLTIIFKKKKEISKRISGGLGTVAVRMPAHKFARGLIKVLGAPIAAPSANISGKPSGSNARHTFEDLKGKVPLIIDGGQSTIGLESTVVKVEKNKILILRPGAVTKEMLEKASGKKVIFAKNKNDTKASPGTRYRHYAPLAKLEIYKNKNALEKRALILRSKGKKVGILSGGNLKKTAKNLYKDIRELDERGVDMILALSFPTKGLGAAIMDRLTRASVR